MYPGPWRELPGVVFVNWPVDFTGNSLSELARFLISREGIQAGDRVSGSSFGGMVACEISRVVDLEQVVLIGSTWNPREINPVLIKFGPLMSILPLRLLQALARLLVPGQLASMFAATDATFMQKMGRAIFSWEGAIGEGNRKPFRIHGSRDWVISCPEDVDVRINGAGHFLSMSHPEECVEAMSSLAEQSGFHA